MNKLELKHLKNYLDCGLKATDGNETVGVTLNNASDLRFANTFKLILRPLSDLEYTKFEFQNDEYVVDMGLSSSLSWTDWEYLFSNHFDVFGLIKKGLAIDINTLE